jgi:excinuclease ABC subunit C
LYSVSVLELDCGQEFDPSRDEDFLAVLPPRPGVCLIELREPSAQPLLIRTQVLRRRLQRLLGPADPSSKRLNLHEHARGVRYRLTGSAFEQTLTYYLQARQRFPERYAKMIRLRPPAILKVSLRNAYPRCFVTRRIAVDASGTPIHGAYYGPFASRKFAQDFANGALDFFKVRRCQIKIRRDPTFPGCLYSEMKMCLAPCFAGCSKEEYAAEVQRLVQFLDTGGDSLRAAIEQERERASDDLDFERAAAIHKRIEKLDSALRGQPELARSVKDIHAVILQRAAEDQTIAAYRIRAGRLIEPCFMRFAKIAGQPRSAEQIFRDYLEPKAEGATPALASGTKSTVDTTSIGATAPAVLPGDLGEHLFLLARWYYSNPREGEIFFYERDWPYRRILRACSRLLNPKAIDPDAGAPSKANNANPETRTGTASDEKGTS